MTDRVLVLADDMGVFLAVVRSLGRRGIDVHVALADEHAPGLASRYISAVHVLPPYHRDAEAWVASLCGLIDVHRYRLVIPCNDSRLLIFRHHAGRIGRDMLAIPNDEAFETFTDKAATRAAAARLGIAVAAGRVLTRGEQAEKLAAELGLPLVLKPRCTYAIGSPQEKTPAKIIRTQVELAEALETFADGSWIAEAFVPGEGVGVSILARRGEVLFASQHRRLQVATETSGSTARVAEQPDPKLVAAARALAGATRLTGVAMFEFRVDRRGGRHALLEVNPRFWGSLPLAVAGGADFPALLWDVVTGAEPQLPVQQPKLVARRNMSGEYARLTAVADTPPGWLAKCRVVAALLSFLPTLLLRSRFDSWAADDPAPYLVERRQICARLLSAATRHLQLTRSGIEDIQEQTSVREGAG